MASYSDAELEALKLLRSAFSWKVSLDQRSGVWVATYAGERIRGDDALRLFDALTLAVDTHRNAYLLSGDHARADIEPADTMACDCCQERLEQLAAVLHEANAQILTVLETVHQDLDGLATMMRMQIAVTLSEK